MATVIFIIIGIIVIPIWCVIWYRIVQDALGGPGTEQETYEQFQRRLLKEKLEKKRLKEEEERLEKEKERLKEEEELKKEAIRLLDHWLKRHNLGSGINNLI